MSDNNFPPDFQKEPSDSSDQPQSQPWFTLSRQEEDSPIQEASAEGISPEQIPQKPPVNVKKEILSWIFTIAAAVIAALLIRTFVFEPVRVDGSSMADTLHDKEMVFVTKFDYLFGDPSRQDVVICHYPDRKEYFVKRLIGLPGDTIEIKYDLSTAQKVVFINGEPLDEPYLTPERNTRLSLMEPITLGEDEYFVMGDNRDNSNDSRNLDDVGPISRKAIVGHVRFVFFPFNQWRTIK